MGAPKGNKYGLGNKGGAPTKYKEEDLINWGNNYLKSCVDTTVDNKIFKVRLPTVAGLCLYIYEISGGKYDPSREYIHELAVRHKGFSYILGRINKAQEQKLIENSLSNSYNATIAKLILGKHGYKEQSDITSDDKRIEGVLVTVKK